MDKMIVKGIEIFAHHGVMQEEKENGQKFILDITAFVHGANNKTNEEQVKQRKQLPLLINILKSISL